MQYTIQRTSELKPNPVMVNGVEIGQVQWSGCSYVRRGGREVRSQGFWTISGSSDTRKFKTMKAAAEALVASI